MINIYLDDVRGCPTPPGAVEGPWEDRSFWEEPGEGTLWFVVRTVKRCLEMLEQHRGDVEILSLDHDLGETETYDADRDRFPTGYDVLCWLEERVHEDPAYPLPQRIQIHSANPAGVARMRQVRDRLRNER